MEIEKAVGQELRACRRRKRISQEQLGFDAAIHRTYVSLIERGVKSPTLGVLFRLCQALGLPRTLRRCYLSRHTMFLPLPNHLEHSWSDVPKIDRE